MGIKVIIPHDNIIINLKAVQLLAGNNRGVYHISISFPQIILDLVPGSNTQITHYVKNYFLRNLHSFRNKCKFISWLKSMQNITLQICQNRETHCNKSNILLVMTNYFSYVL